MKCPGYLFRSVTRDLQMLVACIFQLVMSDHQMAIVADRFAVILDAQIFVFSALIRSVPNLSYLLCNSLTAAALNSAT
jgi:hypothetical protein